MVQKSGLAFRNGLFGAQKTRPGLFQRLESAEVVCGHHCRSFFGLGKMKELTLLCLVQASIFSKLSCTFHPFTFCPIITCDQYTTGFPKIQKKVLGENLFSEIDTLKFKLKIIFLNNPKCAPKSAEIHLVVYKTSSRVVLSYTVKS